jgi:hypothetical protein
MATIGTAVLLPYMSDTEGEMQRELQQELLARV